MTLRTQIRNIAEQWIGPEWLDSMHADYPGIVKELIVRAFMMNFDEFNHPTEIRALHRALSLTTQDKWYSDELAVE